MTSSEKFKAGLRSMSDAELFATSKAIVDALNSRDFAAVDAIRTSAMRRTRPLPTGITWGAPPSLDTIRAARA